MIRNPIPPKEMWKQALMSILIGAAVVAVAVFWLIDTGRDIERGKAAIETIEENRDAIQIGRAHV